MVRTKCSCLVPTLQLFFVVGWSHFNDYINFSTFKIARTQCIATPILTSKTIIPAHLVLNRGLDGRRNTRNVKWQVRQLRTNYNHSCSGAWSLLPVLIGRYAVRCHCILNRPLVSSHVSDSSCFVFLPQPGCAQAVNPTEEVCRNEISLKQR